jgi:polysaccharide biosynthesis/export protein
MPENGCHTMSRNRSGCDSLRLPSLFVGRLIAAAAGVLIGVAIGLLAACPLRAQSTAAESAGEGHFELHPNPAPVAGAAEFLISPDDVLDIYALDVPEISREYRVDPGGSISIPLLSQTVPAAGLTPSQLSDEISERLQKAGLVMHPRLMVQVKASRAHSIAIAGAVKKPQIYPVFTKITLLDAISQAEGLTDDAGNTATITRGAASAYLDRGAEAEGAVGVLSSSPRVEVVDIKRLLEEGDPALNVDLYPGDRVTVQRAGVVYVVGAVNRAGGFVLKNDREQMTVLKAVALADNLMSTAVPKKTVIIRKNNQASNPDREIPVNLDKILEGRAPDQTLLANDILFVPDSATKKALHRAGEAAAQAASLFVYRVP